MKFRETVYSRLRLLGDREPQTFPTDQMPGDYRSAAVLVPLWPVNEDRVKIAFTQRTSSLPSHQGQVSFPGGSTHPDDGSTEITALREFNEELGIEHHDVTIMGRLDDAWSRFGFHITPYVGWLDNEPVFSPDENEVAEVIIADLQTLMRPDVACIHEFNINGLNRRSQAFRWDDGYVWGVTADVLLELILWIKGEVSNRGDVRLKSMQQWIKNDQ